MAKVFNKKIIKHMNKEELIKEIQSKFITLFLNVEYERDAYVDELLDFSNPNSKRYKGYLVRFDTWGYDKAYKENGIRPNYVDYLDFVKEGCYYNVRLRDRSIETLRRLNECLKDRPIFSERDERVKDEFLKRIRSSKYWRYVGDLENRPYAIFVINEKSICTYHTTDKYDRPCKEYTVDASQIYTRGVDNFGELGGGWLKAYSNGFSAYWKPISERELEEKRMELIDEAILENEEKISKLEKAILCLRNVNNELGISRGDR